MPRGKRSGARQITWTVALTPAEFALLEAARGRESRADFLVGVALGRADAARALPEAGEPENVLALRRAWLFGVKRALAAMEIEDGEELAANRTDRGGRPPTARTLSAEQFAKAHARIHRDPWLATHLKVAMDELEDER